MFIPMITAYLSRPGPTGPRALQSSSWHPAAPAGHWGHRGTCYYYYYCHYLLLLLLLLLSFWVDVHVSAVGGASDVDGGGRLVQAVQHLLIN